MKIIYVVSKEFQDYNFWNEITHQLVNCGSNLKYIRDTVQGNLSHLLSAYLKVKSFQYANRMGLSGLIDALFLAKGWPF